jgi:hypothetical protein
MVQRKVLDVPYLVQPTSNTCQSNCLKMFAKYLEKKTLTSNPAGAKDIEQIWREINTSKERPSHIRNAYENMKWKRDIRFSQSTHQIAWRSTKIAAPMECAMQHHGRPL